MSVLRTRRSSTSTCSSLPSFCCDDEDDLSSSSCEDNVFIPIAESSRTQVQCRIRHPGNGCDWRTFLIRSFVIVAICGIVGHNLRPRSMLLEERSSSISSDPVLVEFELNVWGENASPTAHFFTVETIGESAAAQHFLKQVRSGLWDNTSIHLNAPHVMAARPVSGNGHDSKRAQFAALGAAPAETASVLFPHLPYTLAFAGAGPSFYINKQLNEHHDDACFAKVVVGRATIDAISAQQTDDQFRIRPVDIVRAQVVSAQQLNPQSAREYRTTSLYRWS